MNIPLLSYVCSFLAMASAIGSYFVKKKQKFIIAQSLALIMFSFAGFFIENFLPVITYMIAFIRMVIYYVYEKADKSSPFILKTIIAVLNVVAYFVINSISGTLFNAVDILLVVGSVMYTYGSGIRNLQKLRLFFIIPSVLTIVYYALIPNSIFSLISYVFELCANLLSFIIYFDRKKLAKSKSKQN